jgi:hypothetical protein
MLTWGHHLVAAAILPFSTSAFPAPTHGSRYVEVGRAMLLSNLIPRRRDAVGRHWFESIDRLDARGREPPRSFYGAA